MFACITHAHSTPLIALNTGTCMGGGEGGWGEVSLGARAARWRCTGGVDIDWAKKNTTCARLGLHIRAEECSVSHPLASKMQLPEFYLCIFLVQQSVSL